MLISFRQVNIVLFSFPQLRNLERVVWLRYSQRLLPALWASQLFSYTLVSTWT